MIACALYLEHKKESLACQITSPFSKKIVCFCTEIFKILFNNNPSLLLNGEFIWQASASSLTIELHAWNVHEKGVKINWLRWCRERLAGAH